MPAKILGVIRAGLQKNRISIDDGVTIREGFEQTNGFSQGENSSPILFAVLTSRLPALIQGKHPMVKILQFADDIVLYRVGPVSCNMFDRFTFLTITRSR